MKIRPNTASTKVRTHSAYSRGTNRPGSSHLKNIQLQNQNYIKKDVKSK